MIVEAIVVLVGVVAQPFTGAAVGQQDLLQPTVRGKASLKRLVVVGSADIQSVVWPHGKKQREAVHEAGAESLVHPGVSGELAVKILGGAEGIVGLGDVEIGRASCRERV